METIEQKIEELWDDNCPSTDAYGDEKITMSFTEFRLLMMHFAKFVKQQS